MVSLSNEQGHELDILTSYHAIPTLHNETLQDLVNTFHSLLFREDDLKFLQVDIVSTGATPANLFNFISKLLCRILHIRI